MLQKVMKSKENPVYFETMMCSCGESEGLLKHKFTDEVQCVECVNNLMREAEENGND